MVTKELHYEVEQFLYREARLLDEGRFYEWLELLTDDVRYWMPTRETRERREGAVHGEEELALIDDDKNFLMTRVKRFDTGLAHAEQPPSRTRHFVMNVEVLEEPGQEVEVHSNLLVFQSRHEKSENFFIGKREDRLRKVGGQWRIARRKIILDQVLLPRVLSIFF